MLNCRKEDFAYRWTCRMFLNPFSWNKKWGFWAKHLFRYKTRCYMERVKIHVLQSTSASYPQTKFSDLCVLFKLTRNGGDEFCVLSTPKFILRMYKIWGSWGQGTVPCRLGCFCLLVMSEKQIKVHLYL